MASPSFPLQRRGRPGYILLFNISTNKSSVYPCSALSCRKNGQNKMSGFAMLYRPFSFGVGEGWKRP